MHVLVAAATRHGATGEIADAIAAGLRNRGLGADSAGAADVRSLDGYDAVVLGSAVYMGRWLAPAREFATRHGPRLAELPVWLFSSGPVGAAAAETPAEIEGLAGALRARGHVVLAGRLARERLGPAERIAVRVVHAPFGDSRDWEAVDAFAGEIAAGVAHDGARRG